MNPIERYNMLLTLMQEDVATDQEKFEFLDLCQEILYFIMQENADIFLR